MLTMQPKALDEMEESIQEELTRYNALTSRKKYLNNEKYSTFRTLLWVRTRDFYPSMLLAERHSVNV